MTILQHHYTSCEGKGFQTSAVSSALSKDIIMFLEQRGTYNPPLALPSRPTDEEIKNFPVALSYYTVNDETVGVINSVYLGKDYSGRFGNYFAHSLVIDDYNKDMDELLPIQLWSSPIWVSQEGGSSDLPPLPEVTAGDFITWDRILEFLTGSDRLSMYPYLLTALLDYKNTNKRIILVDGNQNVALWIAALTYALPISLARIITFCTYSKNPYSIETLICGTTTDSDFQFSHHEIKFEFYVFDFEENRFSSIPELNPYAEVATKRLCERDIRYFEEFSAFYDEMVLIAPTIGHDIYSIFILYSALKGNNLSEKEGENAIATILSHDLLHRDPDRAVQVVRQIRQIQDGGRALVLRFVDLVKETQKTDVSQIVRYEAVETLFNLVVEKYWSAAPADDIRAVQDEMAGINLLEFQEAYGPRCALMLKKIPEAEKKLPLCALFHSTGLITPTSWHLDEILESEIIPFITQPDYQVFFEGALRTDMKESCINSLGRYLEGQADDRELFEQVSGFLCGDLIFSPLVNYAIRNKGFALYLALHVCPENLAAGRVKAFLDFYTHLDKFSPLCVEDALQEAYAVFWDANLPTFKDTKEVISKLSVDELSSCTFTEDLAEVFCDNIDLTGVSPQMINLAEKVLQSGKVSEQQRILLEIFKVIPTINNLDEKSLEEICEVALGETLNDYPAQRRAILIRVFKTIIRSESMQKLHQDIVDRIIKDYSSDNVVNSAYSEGFNHAIAEERNRTKIIADSFKLWDPYYVKNTIHQGASNDFLYTGFKDAMNSVRMGVRRDTDRCLSQDPRTKARWELYKQRTKQGFLLKFKENIDLFKDRLRGNRGDL